MFLVNFLLFSDAFASQQTRNTDVINVDMWEDRELRVIKDFGMWQVLMEKVGLNKRKCHILGKPLSITSGRIDSDIDYKSYIVVSHIKRNAFSLSFHSSESMKRDALIRFGKKSYRMQLAKKIAYPYSKEDDDLILTKILYYRDNFEVISNVDKETFISKYSTAGLSDSLLFAEKSCRL